MNRGQMVWQGRLTLGLVMLALAGAAVAVDNAGFEAGLENWTPGEGERYTGAISADDKIHRSGQGSLRLHPEQAGDWPWVEQTAGSVQPGALYALRVWVRGHAENDAYGLARLEYLGAENAEISARHRRVRVNDETWRQLEVLAVAPEKATAARLRLRMVGDGQIWFDDVTWEQLADPAPLTLIPPQQALVAGEGQKLPVKVRVRPGTELPGPLQVTLWGKGGKAVSGVQATLTAREEGLWAGELALPALPPADFIVRVEAGKLRVEGRLALTLTQRRPQSLTASGHLAPEPGSPPAGGASFFPIGLYHVGVTDYKAVAEQGFNTLQGVAELKPAHLLAALDAARKAGLRVMAPLHAGGKVAENLPASQARLKAAARHPAVLYWKLADEPSLEDPATQVIPDVYRTLKPLDPLHPLALTLAEPSAAGFWGHFADLVEVTAFTAAEQSPALVFERVAAVRQALEPWQMVVAVLPAGWTMGGETQPSPAQARVMVYQALIAGARGLMWFALRNPNWYLGSTPLWRQFKTLNEETALLGQVVTGGQPVALAGERGAAQGAAWEVGGRRHILLVNPTAKPQGIELLLPGEPEVQRGAVKPQREGDQVKFTLPGLDAVWFTVAGGEKSEANQP